MIRLSTIYPHNNQGMHKNLSSVCCCFVLPIVVHSLHSALTGLVYINQIRFNCFVSFWMNRKTKVQCFDLKKLLEDSLRYAHALACYGFLDLKKKRDKKKYIHFRINIL